VPFENHPPQTQYLVAPLPKWLLNPCTGEKTDHVSVFTTVHKCLGLERTQMESPT
jgi:hypothetical protein